MKELTTNIADEAEDLETDSGEESLHFDGRKDISEREAGSSCFHCGTPLRGVLVAGHGEVFCCEGCLTVFELLQENGLTNFYTLGKAAGVRAVQIRKQEAFSYVDEPAVRARLVDFAGERVTRVTFRIPAMHCVACVWLLENLFRLKPGIGHSTVNFPRKEVFITFENSKVALSEAVALLARLGYEPELKLSDLDNHVRARVSRRLWLQLGIAGFAFGNTMLLSISSYFGLDGFSGPGLRRLFGSISLALAVPVLTYSAADYWRAAWISIRGRMLTIEVPIALGIATLAVWSGREVFASRGLGYFDSLAGLLFFLLCGKLFQLKTYDRLAFDRDYKSFFPLSITRIKGGKAERVSLSQLEAGDRLAIRNGELIPADSRLMAGPGLIDYSFVTGESEPVAKKENEFIYAGGRQTGGTIEIETVKAVSQSYLASLWNHPAFSKKQVAGWDALTNRYSRRFTKVVLAIALGAAVFWRFRDPARALPSFVSVLIVACPCALALAAPFTLGTAQRVLARRNIFLKSPSVIEVLARVDAVVFDKTGTLSAAGSGPVVFHGEPLVETERQRVFSVTQHSTHPYASRISARTAGGMPPLPVRSYSETPGSGIEGQVDGREIWMGSASWLASRQVPVAPSGDTGGGSVHLAVDGKYRGWYSLSSGVRPMSDELIRELSKGCDLALLSGDNEKERETFCALFGRSGNLHFNQSPLHKLEFIRRMQEAGKTVMMVGDGLNDAGALKQSDVGTAVVESAGAFSPASDIIMSASLVPRLHEILRFSKASVRVVRLSFLISGVYNAVGISFAAQGLLSPVICAILMPLSSVTVVAFACGLTTWLGRRVVVEAIPQEATPA